MTEKITRRDFLDGIAIGAGMSLLGTTAVLAAPSATSVAKPANPSYYPPTVTGLRGSHAGSFEVAHALAWNGQKPQSYRSVDEEYDLVIVGAGMSGLAAAWYYRKQSGTDARILILDNHDDFGGHAKRNEFHLDGRMVLGIGGAQNLENVAAYSDAALMLLNDIGIDKAYLSEMANSGTRGYFLGGDFESNIAYALPGESGHVSIRDKWVNYMYGYGDSTAAVNALPLPDEQKEKLITFFSGKRDYLEELSADELQNYLDTRSYNQFLEERVELSRQSIALFDCWLRIYNGFTGWNLSVLEGLSTGGPGLHALPSVSRLLESSTDSGEEEATTIHMFPDGNASIARLLVHKMIPAVAPQMQGAKDVAATKFNYARLDERGHSTRLRLNSTVVGVHQADAAKVVIEYVQDGKALCVTAKHCILACYNGIIPHLCPQLPSRQKEALSYGVKVPFVYANVLLKDGKAFARLGASLVQCPADPFQWISTAPPVSIAGYEAPRSPADPMAIFMMCAPTPAPQQNETARDLFRIGRHKLYATPFETYEQQIRQQLQALLGQHGFNHDTDIQAITVNRIPHGYAYSYSVLEDPLWAEGEKPCEVGRAQFGRISIANSDSEARPYMDAAFDAAWRAVVEQTT